MNTTRYEGGRAKGCLARVRHSMCDCRLTLLPGPYLQAGICLSERVMLPGG